MRYILSIVAAFALFIACNQKPAAKYDVIIRNGLIYDGSGELPFQGDIAIKNDTIAEIGNLRNASGKKEIDANGLAVAPGFINMLSWSDQSLLMDGRSMSDIMQGVTLEVLGEGSSPGPLRRLNRKPADSLWTTLDGYFKWLMKKGVTPNVASFVGATSVRIHEMELANRPPTIEELERMKSLVKQAMEEGAMGLSTALIYVPASYSTTGEIIELAKVASAHGGMYITHMRSEGDFILEAIDETLLISREANIPAEIYHLKINIARNWNKIDKVISKIDSAREQGLKITANMYPYAASATGLNARLPAWVLEGGAREMRRRLRNPAVRRKVLNEMEKGIPYKNSDPSDIVITGFRLDSLNKLYKGKRLTEIARRHGKNADETVIDLIVKDKSRIEAVYYLQSEEIIKKVLKLPYVSIGSDAGSLATTAGFEAWGEHPRAYGTFARILGKYVREEKILTLEEAIRRMTSLPARNLKLKKRGMLVKGHFADLAIFDPRLIRDLATFEDPRQYAAGMVHVFINGVQVLSEGIHTGAKPGRIIYGPGRKNN